MANCQFQTTLLGYFKQPTQILKLRMVIPEMFWLQALVGANKGTLNG